MNTLLDFTAEDAGYNKSVWKHFCFYTLAAKWLLHNKVQQKDFDGF